MVKTNIASNNFIVFLIILFLEIFSKKLLLNNLGKILIIIKPSKNDINKDIMISRVFILLNSFIKIVDVKLLKVKKESIANSKEVNLSLIKYFTSSCF